MRLVYDTGSWLGSSRTRQATRSRFAQRQAGWSRPQMVYLTVGEEEARPLMRELTE
jgi:hypothetical protein